MINGKALAEAGFRYLGVPYSRMDCQAFAEQCLRDCGLEINLAGSNAWYREVYRNGVILTPEECVKRYGSVPPGAFLFILKTDGGEPEKYRADGLGNASHIGIVTGKGEGAVHSSASRGCVAESVFRGKTMCHDNHPLRGGSLCWKNDYSHKSCWKASRCCTGCLRINTLICSYHPLVREMVDSMIWRCMVIVWAGSAAGSDFWEPKSKCGKMSCVLITYML